MNNNETNKKELYTVVLNHKGQYSIWFDDKIIPNGWKKIGVKGGKSECLAHIEEVWTNMNNEQTHNE